MSWNEYSELRGQHALFSPSQPSWLNYDIDTFIEKLKNKYKASLGTELHAWAAIQIELGNKISNKRELMRSFKSYIYQKYYSEIYGLSAFGEKLLKNMKYVPAESYATVIGYINDAISFKMKPEERLRYSENFFGTADAIKDLGDTLIIFDLKTGTASPHVEQLLIYAALYCLANSKNPEQMNFELRLYQGNDIFVATPSAEDIRPIMETIVEFDKIMNRL